MKKEQKNKVLTKTSERVIIRDYIYGDVTVSVKIDFDEEKISLVERDDRDRPKKWFFAERTLDYMAGWQAILDAMKYTISEAEKELRKEVEKREVVKVQLVESLGGLRNE